MTKTVFFLENSVVNDERTFELLKELIKEADIQNYKFVELYDRPNVPIKDLPSYRDKAEKFIEKKGYTTAVFFGNNMLCTFGFEKKPSGITKYRGRRLERKTLPGVSFVAMESPTALAKDRTKEYIFKSNLAVVKKVSEGNFKDQVDMVIHDITEPKHIDDLIAASRKSGLCAYDFETSGLEKNDDIVGTASFCPFIDENGVAHVWYYAEYERLKPVFTKSKLKKLKDKFTEFFELDQNTNFHRIAFNQNFDDWMGETWLGKKFEMSFYDVMYMKWAVNTMRPHNLKFCTSVYLGYPEYDAFFEEQVKKVKQRRTRLLTEEEDFSVLEFFGYEPLKTVKTFKTKPNKVTYRWPKEVSKGKAAYLTVDPEVIREYNSLDSAYTLLLFHKFSKIIKEERLEDTCELRHRAGSMFMRGEQYGLLLDVEVNRKWSKQLEFYISQTEKAIQDRVEIYLPDDMSKSDFNPGSANHVNMVFYGELGKVPVVDRRGVAKYFRTEDVYKLINEVEEEVYEDFEDMRRLLQEGDFSYYNAKCYLEERLMERFFEEDHDVEFPYWVNENYQFRFTDKYLGLGGLQYDPVALTATGNPSTSTSSLMSLNAKHKNEIIELILSYRKCVKYKSTFVEKIYEARDEHNVVRTAHNATGTETGRVSSSKSGEKGFNIQQLPSGFKTQFIARPGYGILSVDLKQAEVYTLAAFADDKVLREALEQRDLHKFVASQIFKVNVEDVTKDQRKAGKTSLFLTVYGGGADKLAEAQGITKKEAQEIIDGFKKAFESMTEWLDEQKITAHTAPYYVKTAFGTRISTRNVLSSDYKEVLHAERRSGNAPIQGSAGEAMIYKLCNIEDRKYEENLDINWLLSVHDSGSWELPLDDVKVEIVKNDDGEEEQKISGFYFDEVICKEFEKRVPYAPLNTITFKIDAEFYDRWGGTETDMLEILKKDKLSDIFRWDIIKPEEFQDDHEEESA